MMTPGIAGSLVLVISLPLTKYFQIKFAWVALLLSFLVSLAIIGKSKTSTFSVQGLTYFVLNAFIIFSACTGAQERILPGPTEPVIDPGTLKALGINTSELQGISLPYLAPRDAYAQDPPQTSQPQPNLSTQGTNAPQGQDTPPSAAGEQTGPQLSPQQMQQLQNYLQYLKDKKAYEDQYKRF